MNTQTAANHPNQPDAIRSGAVPHYEMEMPNPISVDRVKFLVGKGVDRDIAEVDLEMVKMKLREPKEGIGWNREQCEDAEIEYKRYLMLCREYPHPHYAIVPNKIMDTMWHYHILDTRAYCRDCDKLFGGYFHHFPYFGLRGKEDEKQLEQSFEVTKLLYQKTFGESLTRGGADGGSCWHDCQDRCWHACSEDDKNKQ